MSFSNSVKFFLEKHINQGKRNFIIYPYGKIGQEIKRILNEHFGIKEYAIMDNGKASIDGILTPEYFVSHPTSNDTYIILATVRPDIWEECMDSIKGYFRLEQILSVYPLGSYREYCKTLLKERGFDFNTCIYKLSFSDVKFYLPLWNTDCMQRFISLYDQFYEMDSLMYLRKKFLTRIQGKTILDIGANIGNHSLFFSKYLYPKKIYAFEPASDTYAILRKNVDINGLHECVSTVNAGVGAKECKGEIQFRAQFNIGATSIAESDSGVIDIIKIDDSYWGNAIGLIKIDVEGFECQVIEGAKDTISKYKPVIMIEIFSESPKFDEINHFFNQLGYIGEAFNEDNYFFYVP